jgi:TolA-binding protein
MSFLKYICLAILTLLVGFLVHVNYLLLQQLGGNTMTSLPNAMATTKSNRGDDAASQERLHNLRREVSTMKEEVHRLKGVLEKLKLNQQQRSDEDDDDYEGEEEDDDGESSSQR